MKLTKSRLKRIIKEELAQLNEFGEGPEFEMVPHEDRDVEKMDIELENMINDQGSFDSAGFTKAAAQLLSKYAGSGFEDAAWELINKRRDTGIGGYSKE
jgi:hypothetical protein